MSIPAQEARQAPPWGHRRSDGPASSMGTPDRSQPALLVGPSSDPGRRTSHDSAGSSGRREAGRTPNGALRGQGTPFGSLAKNPKRTTLTREQLLKMVTDCYQLSKHNKLDKRNMWNLTLIDCMPQLVRDQCEEDGTFNFATVTCGLDASVEIYAKRVDCTHSMAMDTLTMSKNRGQSTVQRGDEETGGEGDTQAPRRGRAKPVDATSTLLPEETGGEREITTEVPRDPLFRVTAAKFDAAGQEGLFLVQMGPTNGVEDSMHLPVASRIPVYPVPTNCHWGTHEEEGWSTQRPQTCAGVKPTCSRFCELLEVPAIDHGYIFQVVEEAGDTTVCNGSDHRMPLLQTPLTSVSLHGWGKESHSVNLGTSVLEGGSDHDGDFEVMVHGDGVDAGEVDRGDVAGFHLPWHGTPLSPQPVEEILDKNGLMWVLEARFGRLPPTRKIASHWKFPQQQCGEASKQKKRQPRRRKDKPDYTCLPEIDCSSLAPAKRFNRIDLLTRRPAHKLIQEDPYYEVMLLFNEIYDVPTLTGCPTVELKNTWCGEATIMWKGLPSWPVHDHYAHKQRLKRMNTATGSFNWILPVP
ncbi:unnamed protein product [Ostreobium quekettii]|uniref:Condensin complex subunit 2 n=1 Tax=Ostreobium quekettii TaxID=121088 RepID=A0A8S1IJP7_9CHLO|nr:unnamed protein product [Ostreobium quekettii]